jgi:sRNA-binding carbon storage regulator CsrA
MRRFTCRVGEGVVLSGRVTVMVEQIKGEQVRLLIAAPASVGIVETALWDRALAAWEARLAQDQQYERDHLPHERPIVEPRAGLLAGNPVRTADG